MTLEILRRRWRLFGHALRLDINTPAAKAMEFYFKEIGGKRFKGRPRTTIVTTLNDDILTLKPDSTFKTTHILNKLTSLNELEKFRKLALERDVWKCLVEELYQVAKAEGSIHWI